MAIKQPKHFKNKPIPFPQIAGTAMVQTVTYELSGAHTAGTDFFELAVLPHFNKLVSVKIQTAGVAEVATVTAGLISGDARDTTDGTRALGTELVTGGAKNAVIDIAPSVLSAIDPAENDRGIGVNFDVNVAAGTIYLQVSYIS